MKTSILLLAILLVVSSFNLASKPNVPTHQQHKFNFVYPDLVKQLHTMKIPTDIDEQGLEALYHRYYQHYKDFLGPTPAKEVTYDWLMDEDNARISFELQYLFKLAHNKGMDVSRFEVFGLHTKPSGGVHFDHNKTKFLITIDSLFETLVGPAHLETPWNRLIEMGLTSKEVKFIQSYSKQITREKVTSTHIYQYYRYLKSITDSMEYAVKNKHILNSEQYIHALSRKDFAYQYIQFNLWKNVGNTLFKQLTARQKRILGAFLLEQNTWSGTHSKSNPKYELSQISNEIESGEWNKVVELRLNTYRQKERL